MFASFHGNPRWTGKEIDVTSAFAREVAEAPASRPARVGVGSKVTIRRGVLVSDVTIVDEDSADRSLGRIAGNSPLGRALLGAARGDVVELETGGRTEEVLVIALDGPRSEGAVTPGLTRGP
jgi:transcription elongation GreA/GreB family factor